MNPNLGQIVWICMDEWSRTSHRGSRFAWDSCFVFGVLCVSQFWLFWTSLLCKTGQMHLFHYFNFICLRYVSCPVIWWVVLWANFDIFGRHHCAKELGCTCFIISTSVQHKIKLLENLSVELALLKLIRFWMLLVGNCRDGITQNRFELFTELGQSRPTAGKA